jgi:hypothetical protein
MLERAARALHRHDEPTVGWDDITAPRQRMYLSQARTVVAAIRKPSEVMIDAAGSMDVVDGYGRMIDAVLDEPPPSPDKV